MNAILVLVLAGIREKKLQTAVFAACCMLGAFFLLGVFVLKYTMDSSFDTTYEKLAAPNTVISIQETDITEEELNLLLGKLSYVQNYSIGKSYLASQVKMPKRNMDFAFLAASESKKIESGSVVVNNAVYDAVTGEEVNLSVNGHGITLRIDSVVIDPVNSAPESRIPYFWINETDLQKLTEGFDKGSYLVEAEFKSADETTAQFASDYEKYIGSPFEGSLTSYEDIKDSYLFRYEIFGNFMLFLCVFLFLIIIIITVLLAQMNVYADMKRIGILKSFGFTSSQIRMNYVLQFVSTAVISSVVGVFLSGTMLQTWLSNMFSNIDQSLYNIKDLWFYQGVVILCINLLLYLVVRFSIYRIVKLTPLDAIQFKKGKNVNFSWESFLPGSRLLTLNLAMIKIIQRRLESFFIAILTLGMSLLYLTCVYIMDGVKNADVHLSDWGIVEMDIYISRKSNVDEEKSGLLAALKNDPAVDFYYAGLSDNIIYKLPGSGRMRSVVGEVYDKRIPEGLDFIFTEGRNPQQNNEAAVGINFAKENRLGIGDRIDVIRAGEETELEIVGIYPSFNQYGNTIRFLTDDIQRFFGNLANGYYSIVLNDGEDSNIFAVGMAEKFPDFDFFPMERSTVRSVNMLFPPMMVSMILFGLVFILIVLCMTNIMITECRRDLYTYRSLGFTLRNIKSIVRWRFLIPVFAGMVVAIPLSIYVLPIWMQPLAQQLGLSRIPIYPDVIQITIALAGVLFCSLLAIATPLRRMGKQFT